ncbi:MAG: TadE/TadG family type IV pilus assembly protein [Phycisphaeraceae bacterium]|nr:TadE/TadG family type IV pilus assembly protein [Phycisphaeraceae bacterium]
MPDSIRHFLRHHRPGAAMTETVLVLPVLLLILMFLVYFGRANLRVQHAGITDRYEAWRQAADAPGPSSDPTTGNLQLNTTFFGDNAEQLSVTSRSTWPDDASEVLVGAVAGTQFADDTPQYIQRVFETLPGGRQVNVKVTHENRVAVWERFNRPIRRNHVQLDGDWAYPAGWNTGERPWSWQGRGVSHVNAIRDTYFDPFDQALANRYSGNGLAGMIRQLYLRRPAYRGPELQF